ncbi:hypothetical protein CAPTEDRAFT_213456 [Capitella teleta]|uniref:Uncharacterized protein n=1 Tax=Capitella teleta TaxID=283909 RepID=R7T8Y2_CAPTE|nr:hypothetical protein CAPTEDRAFT_213456 [Capitella teleta]|eukprot:ELT90159.1 hypothetical protein CAPTEDRAFT_213456 [Capitella teleta]
MVVCHLRSRYMEDVWMLLQLSIRLEVFEVHQGVCLLKNLERRSLRKLRVKFTGQNPLFYAGTEFVKELECLLSHVPCDTDRKSNTLEVVDFGNLPVALDGTIISCLADNHRNLRKLDIQNGQLVNGIHPSSILNLVKNCRSISDLHIYKNSLSSDVLIELSKENRAPLEHLSTISRSEERFLLDIPPDVWRNLGLRSPHLKVTMKFDHTCLIENLTNVLMYEIPLTELWLESYTILHTDVVQKCLLFQDRLEKLVLITPLPKQSDHFEETLMSLTDQLSKLRSLHVFTTIEEDVKNHILERHRKLVERDSFTLRCHPGQQTWLPGHDCYDPPSHFF